MSALQRLSMFDDDIEDDNHVNIASMRFLGYTRLTVFEYNVVVRVQHTMRIHSTTEDHGMIGHMSIMKLKIRMEAMTSITHQESWGL